ncbi:MAG: tetratricopeptide repeat protein [Candidatus Marinimicrobia bacterium]|nr:tetratricopeptide repeat protein [Candidatus Neomarinimicrobiota bacterium]
MKRIIFPLMIVVLIAAVFSGCASTRTPVPSSEPIIINSDDMNIKLLDRKIENMKDTMTLAFASMDEYYIARTTKLHAQLDRIEAENDIMAMQTDTLIGVIARMNGYLQELNSMPIFFGSKKVIAEQTVETPEELAEVLPEDEIKEIIVKPEVIVPEVKVKEIIKTDAFMENYKEALNKFYYQRYDDAVDIFEKLISEQPKHYLTGNIQYWIGESYYALRQYKKAFNAFNMVFNTNAFDKYDDTQLKLGFCYFKMGKMRSAVGEFQNLLTYYPNSEHVTIAIRQIGIIEMYTVK